MILLMFRVKAFLTASARPHVWIVMLLLSAQVAAIAHQFGTDHVGPNSDCSWCAAIDRLDDAIADAEAASFNTLSPSKEYVCDGHPREAAELPPATSRSPPLPA